MRIVLGLVAAVLVAIAPVQGYAKVKTVGSGDKITFDQAQIPADMKGAFEIMKVKCIQCHTMERTVIAIQSGIAPVTGQPFDKNATKSYGVKMLRKPKSNMSREDVKQVVGLLNYLLDQSGKP